MTLNGEKVEDFVMHKITSNATPRNGFSARLLVECFSIEFV